MISMFILGVLQFIVYNLSPLWCDEIDDAFNLLCETGQTEAIWIYYLPTILLFGVVVSLKKFHLLFLILTLFHRFQQESLLVV